jgi:hypothetical protein
MILEGPSHLFLIKITVDYSSLVLLYYFKHQKEFVCQQMPFAASLNCSHLRLNSHLSANTCTFRIKITVHIISHRLLQQHGRVKPFYQ